MKIHILLLLFVGQLAFITQISAQNIAINGTGSLPDTSAMLDVSSTNKGFLAPRLTTFQQNTIPLPANGLLIYNTEENSFKVNTGSTLFPAWSTLGLSGNNWNITGNSSISSATNFIGSTNFSSVRFKSNNVERMVIDSLGMVGIGTRTPAADLTINQGTGVSTSRGLRFTGNPVSGPSTGTGFAISLGYNVTNNKQLWLGDADYLGNPAGTFFRYSVSNGYCLMDAVSGDNGSRRSVALGVGGDGNSAVILGSDNNSTAPSSYVWANGNMAIGNGYRSFAAPSNGLIVQGNVGIGTGSTAPAQTLDVNGTARIATLNSGAVTDSVVTVNATTGLLNRRSVAGLLQGTLDVADTVNMRVRPVAGTNLSITGTYPNLTFNATGGSGTVTSASIATQNGFAGTVATPSTTPVITLRTSVTGIIKGNGTALSAAAAGTDYSAGTAALATGILKSTTTTGALTIATAADFPTLNQNTSGTAANVTGVVAIANGGTGSATQNFVDLTTAQTVAGNKNLTGATTLAGANTLSGATAISGTLGVSNASIKFTALAAGVTSDEIVTIDASTGSLKRRTVASVIGGNSWAIGGNSGITQPAAPAVYGTSTLGASENFMGTEDAKDLVLATNNKERMRILNTNGYLGIGTSTPSKPIDLVSSLPNVGLVKLQNTDPAGYSSIDIWSNTTQVGNIGFSNGGATYPNSFYFATNTTNSMVFATNNTERFRIDGNNGNLGIGVNAPTAVLHLEAGTATAGTAPLKFNSGTNLSAVENGAVEYDGTNYFATSGGTRYTLAKTLTNTGVLDFPSTSKQVAADLNITVNGAQLGDVVSLGVPFASVVTSATFTAYVSAANTVTVRYNNNGNSTYDPASGTFRVTVIRY